MKSFNIKNLFFLLLVFLISCKKKDDEVTPADDPLDVQAKKIEALWDLKDASSATKDGSVVADFADLTLTFSAGSKAGGNFNTSNSGNASVWPNSGSWTFEGGDKNKLKRNDNVVMTISLTNTDNDLKVSFNVASGVKQGNWVFDFVKK